MGSDVFLQHARLLAADAALLTYVLPPAAAAHIDIVLVGFVPIKSFVVIENKHKSGFMIIGFYLRLNKKVRPFLQGRF